MLMANIINIGVNIGVMVAAANLIIPLNIFAGASINTGFDAQVY
jgi:hypothetical protein